MATKSKGKNTKSTKAETKKEETKKEETVEAEESVETKNDVVEETRNQQKPQEDSDNKPVKEQKEESPKIVKGEVYGIRRLKLRKRPLADNKTEIVKLLEERQELKVNLELSTENYYHVTVGNHEIAPTGFCNKKYIQLEEE